VFKCDLKLIIAFRLPRLSLNLRYTRYNRRKEAPKPWINWFACCTSADPESVKGTDDSTVFFTLLGSTSVKAECRMLMKLTPGVDFINVLWAAFMHADPKSAKKTDNLTLFLLFQELCVKKLLKEH